MQRRNVNTCTETVHELAGEDACATAPSSPTLDVRTPLPQRARFRNTIPPNARPSRERVEGSGTEKSPESNGDPGFSVVSGVSPGNGLDEPGGRSVGFRSSKGISVGERK